MEVVNSDLQVLLGEKVMLVTNLELNNIALSRALDEATAAKCNCGDSQGKEEPKKKKA